MFWLDLRNLKNTEHMMTLLSTRILLSLTGGVDSK